MIRLIASDLDGTLLLPNGQLPDEIFPMIRRLRAKGIRFAAASGRQYGNVKRLFLKEAEQMDFICENGANVVTQGVSRPRLIAPEMARQIMEDILAAGMDLLVCAPETCYVLSSAGKAYTDGIVYRLRNTVTVIDDYRTVCGESVKISGFHPGGVATFTPALQEKWNNKIHCDIAGNEWLDFTMANKGDGIRALSETLGIPLSDIAAFGDQFNDDSMLSLAGHPYIMASAPEPLLHKGYTLCASVTDTLAEILSGKEI
ncbi:MAG: HAD-IIB family hydrolase [Clostridia bacterium]|nr:HAD-IIB family hydrolase [Clostridia bacterium]